MNVNPNLQPGMMPELAKVRQQEIAQQADLEDERRLREAEEAQRDVERAHEEDEELED